MNDPIFNSLNSSVKLHFIYGVYIGALVSILTDEQKAPFRDEVKRLAKEYVRGIPQLTEEDLDSIERALDLQGQLRD